MIGRTPQALRNAAAMERAAVRGRSLWDDARRRMLHNKAAVGGAAVLAVMTLAALVGPHLTPFGMTRCARPTSGCRR